jgi:hypothetical protein
MHDNYVDVILESTKLPFFNSNRKIKERLYVVVYLQYIEYFKNLVHQQ